MNQMNYADLIKNRNKINWEVGNHRYPPSRLINIIKLGLYLKFWTLDMPLKFKFLLATNVLEKVPLILLVIKKIDKDFCLKSKHVRELYKERN